MSRSSQRDRKGKNSRFSRDYVDTIDTSDEEDGVSAKNGKILHHQVLRRPKSVRKFNKALYQIDMLCFYCQALSISQFVFNLER